MSGIEAVSYRFEKAGIAHHYLCHDVLLPTFPGIAGTFRAQILKELVLEVLVSRVALQNGMVGSLPLEPFVIKICIKNFR